jgi:hypothetical protein
MPPNLPAHLDEIARLGVTPEIWQKDLETRYVHILKTWGYECWIYKRACTVCGAVFYARRPEAKYCSQRCSNNGCIRQRRERAKLSRHKKCASCGKEFDSARKDGRYCSSACKQSAYRKRMLPLTVLPTLRQRESVTVTGKRIS